MAASKQAKKWVEHKEKVWSGYKVCLEREGVKIGIFRSQKAQEQTSWIDKDQRGPFWETVEGSKGLGQCWRTRHKNSLEKNLFLSFASSWPRHSIVTVHVCLFSIRIRVMWQSRKPLPGRSPPTSRGAAAENENMCSENESHNATELSRSCGFDPALYY